MYRYYGVLLLVSCLCAGSIRAQSLRLQVLDSILIERVDAILTRDVLHMAISDTAIYILDRHSTFHTFDTYGKAQSKFIVYHPGTTRFNKPGHFQILDSIIYFQNYHGFSSYTLSGKVLGIRGLALQFGTIDIDWWPNSFPASYLLPKHDLIINPVCKGYEADDDKIKDRFYSDYKLFALYPFKLDEFVAGNADNPAYYVPPTSTFGDYDSIYLQSKYLPHLLHRYWLVDEGTLQIYYSLQASPVIHVTDISGKEITKFGVSGRSIKKPHPTPQTTIDKNNPEFRAARIEENLYEHLARDSTTGFVYRSYLPGIPPIVPEKESYEYTAKLVARYGQKPRFLQVYDKEYQLIGEIRVPHDFHIIKANGGIIWAVESKPAEEITIKQYEVVKD